MSPNFHYDPHRKTYVCPAGKNALIQRTGSTFEFTRGFSKVRWNDGLTAIIHLAGISLACDMTNTSCGGNLTP